MAAMDNVRKEGYLMATTDTCCTIVPYFKVNQGRLDEFKSLCTKMIERTSSEPKCLYYGFSFSGDAAHCREGYVDGDGVLAHLGNVDALLKEALTISELTRFEVHGPTEELAKLREPLAGLGPEFFTLEYGFRR
jgi:quinol monooxygenase YgiN